MTGFMHQNPSSGGHPLNDNTNPDITRRNPRDQLKGSLNIHDQLAKIVPPRKPRKQFGWDDYAGTYNGLFAGEM